MPSFVQAIKRPNALPEAHDEDDAVEEAERPPPILPLGRVVPSLPHPVTTVKPSFPYVPESSGCPAEALRLRSSEAPSRLEVLSSPA